MPDKQITGRQDSAPKAQAPAEPQPELAPPEPGTVPAALGQALLGGAPPLKPSQVLALQRRMGNRATLAVLSPAVFQRPTTDTLPASDAIQRQEELDPAAPYQSQTVNTYSRGRQINWGDMCNVTTLAMQLIRLAGDEETAKAGAIELITRNQASSTPRQAHSQVLGRPAAELAQGGEAEALQQAPLADLIMMRFDQITNAQWRTLLGRTFPERNRRGRLFERQRDLPGAWFQKAIPLAAVGTEILDVIGETTGRTAEPQHLVRPQGVSRQRFYTDTLLPLLGEGKAILASTGMSGAGHIVFLAEVVAAGIVINDPNGMLFRRNGWWNDRGRLRRRVVTNPRNRHHAVLLRRLTHNPGLLAELQRLAESEEVTNWPANMGERNFFTWDEVDQYRIGNWFNALGWGGGEG
jgi:hypothetical protein